MIAMLFSWTLLSAQIPDDSQAFDYCMTHHNSFVAIVWPIAQGKDERIKRTLNKYGQIKYQKNLYFNPEQALALLTRAHYNAKIADMKEHFRWYFPSGTFEHPARIFVVKFKNVNAATECKYAVRRLFNLQYRAIHINDTHNETMELAELFFSK